MKRVVLGACIAVASSVLSAAPLQPDTLFGTNGIASLDAGPSSEFADAIAAQADGKLLMAGPCDQQNCLLRFDLDGKLDASFNQKGWVVLPPGIWIGGNYPRPDLRLLVQQDGKILVITYCSGGNGTSLCVLRYNADGSADSGFNGTGAFQHPVGSSGGGFPSVVLQPDGKLVVAGGCQAGICFMRLTVAGALDPSFGSAGETIVPGSAGISGIFGMDRQPDGKLVFLTICGSPQFCLARITESGQLDATFGSAGKQQVPVQYTWDQSSMVATQADAKIVLAGNCGGRYFCIRRYFPDGTPDTPFNDTADGNPIFVLASGVSQQADGKLLIAASCWSNGDFFPCAVRLNADGSADTTFGNGGLFNVALKSHRPYATAAVLADGRFYLSTACNPGGTFSLLGNLDYCAARVTQTGALDTSFNGTGVVRPYLTRKGGRTQEVLTMPDGKIVAAGICDSEGAVVSALDGAICVARFDADGSPDLTFNGRGSIQFDMDSTMAMIQPSFAAQPDGKVLAATACMESLSDVYAKLCVARIGADGTLDAAFASTGMAVIAVESYYNARSSVGVQPDGKVVVAIGCRNGSSAEICLLRLLQNGTPDATFGTNGVARAAASAPGAAIDRYSTVGGMALQSDGRIVVAANCPMGTSSAPLCVFRFQTNGVLDAGFGNAGKTVTTLPGTSLPVRLELQADGKLVAGGSCDVYGCLFRFNSDGTPDTSFNGSGVIVNSAGQWLGLAVQPDGAILSIGYCSPSGVCVVRWNADGSRDLSFNDSGTLPNAGSSLRFQPDGKLLVASWDGPMAVARFVAPPAPVPPAFVFTAQNDVPLSTMRVSNALIPPSVTAPTSISVSNGEYALDCTSNFVSTPGTIAPGQSVCVRHTASPAPYTSVVTTLTVGSSTGQFVSTTAGSMNVTLEFVGQGSGTVTSSPAGISCTANCVATFPAGTTVTLTATPANGFGFLWWDSLGVGCAEDYRSPTCTFVVVRPVTIGANFQPIVTLTVAKTGSGTGTLMSSELGIDCGAACTSQVLQGSFVSLTAQPDPGFAVASWSNEDCYWRFTCQFRVGGGQPFTVRFEPGVKLTVQRSGPGNVAIEYIDRNFDCGSDCVQWILPGKPITLRATAEAGAVFLGWTGACSGSAPGCNVTMNQAKTVKAHFASQGQTWSVTVDRAGAGTGTVSSTPAGMACGATCTASYPAGSAVTLTAFASAGSTFLGWSEAGCSGTGTCTVRLLEGNVTAQARFGPAAGPAVKGDFTGDGHSDLIWYNASTGALYGIAMDGLTVGVAGLLDHEPNLAWQVAAIADLNGDGRADAVWRNEADGRVFALLLNGFASISDRLIYNEPNLQWRIVGAGDFNGDGNADLLWKNEATGDVFQLLLNGTNVVSGGVIYSEPNTSWQIQRVADFNGDGRADILWRNATTGDVFVTLMNGTTVVGGGVVYSEPNTAWQIQAAADFNGDGRADVLWRNATTGDVFMMLMNGTTITGGSVFYGEPNADWKIVATGDYNGDGRADILWRNTTTGQVFMMLMNGFTISGGDFVYAEPDQNWKVLGP